MVSASSSASSIVLVLRASDGVRGRTFECRIGKGEELRAMLQSCEVWASVIIGRTLEASSV